MSASLASERYALLVNQLGEDRKFARGWKTDVARLLDVHQTYITKIHSGERQVIGHERIEHAITALSLSPDWFYSSPEDFERELKTKPRWQDWVDRSLRATPVHDGVPFSRHTLKWTEPLYRCIVAWKVGTRTQRIAVLRRLASDVMQMKHVRLAQQILESTDPEQTLSMGEELMNDVATVALALQGSDASLAVAFEEMKQP